MKKYLIFILFLALLIRLVFFSGLGWSDDVSYVYYANTMKQGIYSPDLSPNSMRLMIFLPAAFLFYLFGVSQIAAIAPSLIFSLISIVTIYWFGSKFNKKIGIMSALFLALIPIDVLFSTQTMGEVHISLFSSLAIIFFLLSRKKQDIKLFLLSGLFIGLAYLVKIMGLLPLLFIIIFFIYDVYKKKPIKLYPYLLAGFALILLLESTLYLNTGGNFFYKVNTFSHFSDENFFQTSIDFYPKVMFSPNSSSYFGYLFYFVFAGSAYFIWKRKKKYYPLIIWTAVFLLFLQFGTMSLTEYKLLHRLDRHLSIIIIPSILILSSFLYELRKKSLIIIVILILTLTWLPAIHNIHQRHLSTTADVELVYDYVKDKKLTLYSDPGTNGHLNFYSGFKLKTKSVENAKCNEFSGAIVITDPNSGWLYNPHFRKSIPKCLKHIPDNWILEKEIETKYKGIYEKFNPKIYSVP